MGKPTKLVFGSSLTSEHGPDSLVDGPPLVGVVQGIDRSLECLQKSVRRRKGLLDDLSCSDVHVLEKYTDVRLDSQPHQDPERLRHFVQREIHFRLDNEEWNIELHHYLI